MKKHEQPCLRNQTADSERCYHRECLQARRAVKDLIAAIRKAEKDFATTACCHRQLAIVDQLRAARFLVSRFGKVEEST